MIVIVFAQAERMPEEIEQAYAEFVLPVHWNADLRIQAAVPIAQSSLLSADQREAQSPQDQLWPFLHMVLVRPRAEDLVRLVGRHQRVCAALVAWLDSFYGETGARIGALAVSGAWVPHADQLVDAIRGHGMFEGDLVVLPDDCGESAPERMRVIWETLPSPDASRREWGQALASCLSRTPKMLMLDDEAKPVRTWNLHVTDIAEALEQHLGRPRSARYPVFAIQINRLEKKRNAALRIANPDDIVLLDRLIEGSHERNQEFARDMLGKLASGRGVLYSFTSARGETSWLSWEERLQDRQKRALFPVRKSRTKKSEPEAMQKWCDGSLAELAEFATARIQERGGSRTKEIPGRIGRLAEAEELGKALGMALANSQDIARIALAIGLRSASTDSFPVCREKTDPIKALFENQFWSDDSWSPERASQYHLLGDRLEVWFDARKVFKDGKWGRSNAPLQHLWAWYAWKNRSFKIDGPYATAQLFRNPKLAQHLHKLGDELWKQRTGSEPAQRALSIISRAAATLYPGSGNGPARLGHAASALLMFAQLTRNQHSHYESFHSFVTPTGDWYGAYEEHWRALSQRNWIPWEQVANWFLGQEWPTGGRPPPPSELLKVAVLRSLA